jgi:MacB-like periplasmic core domain
MTPELGFQTAQLLVSILLRKCLQMYSLDERNSIIGDLVQESRGVRPAWLRGVWLVWHGSAIAVGFVIDRMARAGAARNAGPAKRGGGRGRLGDGAQRVRQAARSLARRPLHAVTAAVTLSLGVGISTAVFTIVWHGLMEPLPYSDAGRLLRIGDRGLDDPVAAFSSMSMQNVLDLRAASRSLEGLETFAYEQYNVTGDGGPVRVLGMTVSPGFFDLLGVRPWRGRFFDRSDVGAGTAVLSHGAWRDEFGSDPEILGRTVVIDRVPRRIIGILPASFSFPAGPRMFTVLDESAPLYAERGRRMIDGVARLRDGTALEQARQELESIFRRLALAQPKANEGWTVAIAPLSEWMIGRTRKLVGLFAAATLFVLLIAVWWVPVSACSWPRGLSTCSSPCTARPSLVLTRSPSIQWSSSLPSACPCWRASLRDWFRRCGRVRAPLRQASGRHGGMRPRLDARSWWWPRSPSPWFWPPQPA